MRKSEWQAKFNLWFFRDMSDQQREKLFSIFGLPTSEIRNHGLQRHALRHVFEELAKATGEAG